MRCACQVCCATRILRSAACADCCRAATDTALQLTRTQSALHHSIDAGRIAFTERLQRCSFLQVISYEKQSHEALRKVIPPHNLISRLGGTSEVDLLDEQGAGPWTDSYVREQVSRSKWRYKDSSSLTDSSASADTVMNTA